MYWYPDEPHEENGEVTVVKGDERGGGRGMACLGDSGRYVQCTLAYTQGSVRHRDGNTRQQSLQRAPRSDVAEPGSS